MSKEYVCELHGNGNNRFGKCQKGSCNNSYGKVLTEEQIENKRKAAYINWEKNRETLVENIKRQANSIEGKKTRSETAKRLNEEGKIGGQLQKGKKHSEGCNCGNCIRTGNQFTNNGYVMSDKHKENIGEAGKKVWSELEFQERMKAIMNDPERIVAYKETMKQYWEDNVWKKNISEKVSLLWEDDEYRKNIITKNAERWDNEAYRQARLLDLRKARLTRPNRIENILYHLVYNTYTTIIIEREYLVNRKALDVAIPSLMLDFEADGDYWHNLPGAKERDAIRDRELESLDWIVIRLMESELLLYAKEYCPELLSKNS